MHGACIAVWPSRGVASAAAAAAAATTAGRALGGAVRGYGRSQVCQSASKPDCCCCCCCGWPLTPAGSRFLIACIALGGRCDRLGVLCRLIVCVELFHWTVIAFISKQAPARRTFKRHAARCSYFGTGQPPCKATTRMGERPCQCAGCRAVQAKLLGAYRTQTCARPLRGSPQPRSRLHAHPAPARPPARQPARRAGGEQELRQGGAPQRQEDRREWGYGGSKGGGLQSGCPAAERSKRWRLGVGPLQCSSPAVAARRRNGGSTRGSRARPRPARSHWPGPWALPPSTPSSPPTRARSRGGCQRRQVIKIGTSSLIHQEYHSLNLSNLARVCEVIKQLHSEGKGGVHRRGCFEGMARGGRGSRRWARAQCGRARRRQRRGPAGVIIPPAPAHPHLLKATARPFASAD
jgi:hypothetical protein